MGFVDVIESLLRDIALPRMAPVRQKFDGERLVDPVRELHARLRGEPTVGQVAAGARVAVAVGSRGMARLPELVAALVAELKAAGARPFIVPAMGSHGGATAEGQQAVLAQLGVTEETAGAPVVSSLDVVLLGHLPSELPVYVDRAAAAADAIVVVNRVKPHTAFRGPYESGLMKMIAIGLGKQKGAEACHQLGFKHMAQAVPAVAGLIMQRLPVAFAVATVENAYDEIARIEVVPAADIAAVEPELLADARARMPFLPFPELDVLVIDWIGKNISGDGMDPNITGRYPTPYASGGPVVNKLAVLDLTAASEGNANGVGTADFTTRALADKIDFAAMYANGLTSTVCAPTKLATVLPTDELALKAAVKTSNILDYGACRLVRVENTLRLDRMWVSEALLPSLAALPSVTVCGELRPMAFDDSGSVAKGPQDYDW